MSELLDEVVSGIVPETPVTHGQLRALAVLVESLVTRMDGLQEQVAMLEKRPVVKSRAEYMRNYRKKDKVSGSGYTVIGPNTPEYRIPAEQPVSDTPTS